MDQGLPTNVPRCDAMDTNRHVDRVSKGISTAYGLMLVHHGASSLHRKSLGEATGVGWHVYHADRGR